MEDIHSHMHSAPDLSGHSEPWDHLLAHAAPQDHIVHLYQDQNFLNRVVCRFAAAALANGEGVIVVPTMAHWEAFRPRLEAEGVDVKGAQKSGQLNIVDSDELLPRFMQQTMPDGPMFLGLAGEIIARTRAAGRFRNVRWWGEMVNVLWERGDVAASMNLEDLFDRVSREQNIAVFCSFLMDNFNGDVHTHMLPRLGDNHSHLIPVEDYTRLERAVAEALRETVGPDEAMVLQDRLLTQYQAPFKMPPAQALLLALRQTLPAVAESVLQRSRSLYPGAADGVTVPYMTRSDGWIHFDQDHRHTAGACSTTGDLIDILDAVDVPIVVVSPEFTVTCFNRTAAEMLGFGPSDVGRSPADLPLLRSFEKLEARCAQAIATETASRYDFRDRDKSYLLRIAPYAQSDGRITGSVLTFANVTAFRASIEQAIYEREYTKTILNTVTDPLAVLNPELRILTGNRAFYTMFRLSREPMVSLSLGEIGNGALDRAPLQERLKSALTEGGEFEPFEIDHDFPGIGRRIVLVSASRFVLPGGSGNMLLLAVRDVTDRCHAEDELRDRERRIRELINALPAAVYTTDAKGRVTFYNKAAVEFAGRQPVLGTDRWCICSRLFWPDGTSMSSNESPMAIALKEDRSVRGSEAIAERPDGIRITFVPYPTPLHDASGTLIGAVNMLVDITERKKTEEAVQRLAETLEERVAQRTSQLEREIAGREKAQEALRQSQKMEAVGQLTGGVAHDFNNLLTVVTGNLDLLERWAEAHAAARRYVETAQRAAWQGARLAQQLLAFARQQDLRPEILHLGHAMGEYESLLRRALGEAIEVTIDCDPDLWRCRIDPAQFENSILNLVFNARDAMPAGGGLTISVRNIELDGSNGPTNAAPGQYVLVAVADTGVGIAPDQIDRVFEPFYTTKEVGRGTGLGLSQVYGFVEQSGGYVDIESKVGAGTTVMIYLPKTAGVAAGRRRRSSPAEAPALGSETVLLVEDDRGVLEVVTAMMEELGYRVLTARNGVEALSILERGEPIDLLFTDLVMPHGISGGELALRARQMRPELKILLGSGYSARMSPDTATAVADLPILGKPYRRDELAAKLRSVLVSGTGLAAMDIRLGPSG